MQQRPTVEQARPARCPVCGVASHPAGGSLRLHGHGRRARQVRGPGSPTETAATVDVEARRYRCLSCRAVLLVVPRGVRARGLYSAAAIGLALALWGLAQTTAREVRQRISPDKILGDTAAAGWATLRRWARAVAARRLFAATPLPAPGATLRRVAANAASALAAHADPTTRGDPILHRAFFGAAHAA